MRDMIENRPEERAELETRARWALEHPEQREPRGVVEGFRPMLRLWHYPAFANDISWTVFAPVSRGIVLCQLSALMMLSCLPINWRHFLKSWPNIRFR